MVLYGYHTPSITLCLRDNYKVQVVEYNIKHQQQGLQLLKDNLSLTQSQMNQKVHHRRREISFDVGDLVFL